MSDPFQMLQVSTQNHQMTILRDEGLYRHIRFQEPGTGIWRFDLVTWPGHLVITGDLEDYHFARIDDMFEFFRNPVGYINPQYWAEKLRGPVQAKTFSEEVFKRRVYEVFRDWCEWNDGPHRWLWRDICDRVLRDDYGDVASEDQAHRALMDFRHTNAAGNQFEFNESWEWDLKDFDWHYLVSLHAIVWGINQYDQARQQANA
ncbi:hypothetical protein DOROTHY_63 [Mycobacterium phage Dorothy]|uniref:Uncharacterized protein n=10 Tax=Cheoctovirus TaxID=1623281 RepID=A0A249XQ08_9CAUD|nr:hypothetical protein N856_gp059 [Mycobacterium phage Daenerys]YP_009125341.1 hypothetical protein VC69_gp060 [Mycobacterium phage Inventum]YP_009592038.1 hypothetical protein FDG65_gp063 [Mycobacterium phage Dorothy]YP_009954961.1 hypothetical protein I5H17_gp065 [Mycobacterium phage BodEinwohner17]YP_009956731.1 hypothetical protein I5H34_gp063 [Mycobacterium phage Empress]YP_009958297.1 hypothetical protein I5H49_gp060 [Mycobacterium phage JoeyJr]YP_009960748.1 hypothetical protein I5H73